RPLHHLPPVSSSVPRPPPTPPLFPYTTLFRSGGERALAATGARDTVNQRRLRNRGASGARDGNRDRREIAIEEPRVERHPGALRSEEHTSELQSRGQLVCRLLLEKKTAVHATP